MCRSTNVIFHHLIISRLNWNCLLNAIDATNGEMSPLKSLKDTSRNPSVAILLGDNVSWKIENKEKWIKNHLKKMLGIDDIYLNQPSF